MKTIGTASIEARNNGCRTRPIMIAVVLDRAIKLEKSVSFQPNGEKKEKHKNLLLSIEYHTK